MSGAKMVLAVFVAAIGLGGWAWLRLVRHADPAPLLEPRGRSQALAAADDTRFGRLLVPLVAARPGLSGIHMLDDPREAFAARMLLIESAMRSLDIQYYMWHPDVAGTLLMAAVWRAAIRGVRVRLLLDDNGTGGLDALMMAVDAHDNVEVRLFNPFVIRWPKTINYLLDFRRLNRRMHNKSLTADGALTIVGGRNIGDEYLGATNTNLFVDIDVLAMGAIVPAVAADFDRYWACDSAYPAGRLLGAATPSALDDALAEASGTKLGRHYAQALRDTAIEAVISGAQAIEWAPVVLVSDDPAKGLRPVRRAELLVTRMATAIGTPRVQLGLVSAYFVPTAAGVAAFAEMARAGLRIDVLTNALKANDVAIVHASYAPCRQALLAAGVRLWELKGPDPGAKAQLRFRGSVGSGAGSRGGRRAGSRAGFRVRGSALHAKALTADRQRLFVGSFNFDPRSVMLNTEMGLVIDSAVLAGRLQDMFDGDVAMAAYEVRLAGGGLEWVERGEGGEVVHVREPGTGPLQRLVLRGLGRLPIRWLL